MRITVLIVLLVAECIVLGVLLRPRRPSDAPGLALHLVQEAEKVLSMPVSRRNYRKLHRWVGRAAESLSGRRIDEAYDLGAVHDELVALYKLCGALTILCPEDPSPYVSYFQAALESCRQRLMPFVGNVTSDSGCRSFTKAARMLRAKRLLSQIETSADEKPDGQESDK